MISYLTNLLSGKNNGSDSDNIKDYETEGVKKSKFPLDDTTNETYLYIHKEPKRVNKEYNMPSYLESADNINTNQIEIFDEKTGRKMMVDASTAQRQMEQIPPGINIPGIGPVGGRQNPNAQRQNQQRQPQQQPHQQQQRPQNRMQAPQLHEEEEVRPSPRPIPSQMTNQSQQSDVAYPATEMASVEGAYHIWIDLAGVKRENVKVSYNNSILVVSGSRISNLDLLELDGEGNRRTHSKKILQESSTVPHYLLGDFSFSYPFKKLIDETSIQATFTDGVLHIVLPHRVKGEEVIIPIM